MFLTIMFVVKLVSLKKLSFIFFYAGAIRVYCRVKPFQPEQSDEQSTVDYIGENGNIMIINRQKQGKEARKMFSFNKVFGGNTTQRK